jgi:hypothetical protein
MLPRGVPMGGLQMLWGYASRAPPTRHAERPAWRTATFRRSPAPFEKIAPDVGVGSLAVRPRATRTWACVGQAIVRGWRIRQLGEEHLPPRGTGVLGSRTCAQCRLRRGATSRSNAIRNVQKSRG